MSALPTRARGQKTHGAAGRGCGNARRSAPLAAVRTTAEKRSASGVSSVASSVGTQQRASEGRTRTKRRHGRCTRRPEETGAALGGRYAVAVCIAAPGCGERARAPTLTPRGGDVRRRREMLWPARRPRHGPGGTCRGEAIHRGGDRRPRTACRRSGCRGGGNTMHLEQGCRVSALRADPTRARGQKTHGAAGRGCGNARRRSACRGSDHGREALGERRLERGVQCRYAAASEHAPTTSARARDKTATWPMHTAPGRDWRSCRGQVRGRGVDRRSRLRRASTRRPSRARGQNRRRGRGFPTRRGGDERRRREMHLQLWPARRAAEKLFIAPETRALVKLGLQGRRCAADRRESPKGTPVSSLAPASASQSLLTGSPRGCRLHSRR